MFNIQSVTLSGNCIHFSVIIEKALYNSIDLSELHENGMRHKKIILIVVKRRVLPVISVIVEVDKS